MSNTLTVILIVLGILISIVVSIRYKVNGGIPALIAAWIVGSWCNGTPASTLVGYWPTSVTFILISTSLFFGVARQNGTLALCAEKMLYRVKGATWFIPFAIFAIAFCIGAAGAGALATELFFSTLIYNMAKQLKVNPLVYMIAAFGGATSGGGMFWSSEGVNRIAYYTGIVPDEAVFRSVAIYSLHLVLTLLLLLCVYYLFFRGWKTKNTLELKEPAPFTGEQKKTVIVVLVSMTLIVGSAVLKMAIPCELTKRLAVIFDVQFVCIAGFLVCYVLKLCNEKECIRAIPMDLILTIGGFCVLIKVAVAANLPEFFSDVLLNAGIPAYLLPSMFLIFAACISLFSNFTVIYPLLMPVIPIIASATGVNSLALFTGMCLGSCATGFSPFSSGGACIISGCTDPALREKLIPRMLLVAVCNALIMACVCATGIFGILPDPLALVYT